MFKSIKEEAIAEIIEKKSKFIAVIKPVNTKEEAEKELENVRKKFYDAKHNCYAYIVDNYEKYSDDGEPSGTAGAPLLNLLKNEELKNVIVVATRYFGGILLGTGGLVRAYTESAQKALENAEIVKKDYGNKYILELNYNNLNEFQYLCKKLKIRIIDMKYMENIQIIIETTDEVKKLLDQSNIEFIKNQIFEKNVIIEIE